MCSRPSTPTHKCPRPIRSSSALRTTPTRRPTAPNRYAPNYSPTNILTQASLSASIYSSRTFNPISTGTYNSFRGGNGGNGNDNTVLVTIDSRPSIIRESVD